MTDEHFDLMRAKLEEAKAAHRADLNRELFSGVGACHTVVTPDQWRRAGHRLTRAWWRVRAYLSTLWLALIGAELAPPNDDY